jgi:hypothetical protein
LIIRKWTAKSLVFALLASVPLHCQTTAPEALRLPALGERFRDYLHRTYTCRERLTFLAADAGIAHFLNGPEEWGRGPETFGFRLASNFGARVVANSIEFGAGAALEEDSRYRRSGLTGFRKRAAYAAASAFRARRPGGETRFGYSRLAATTAGVLISSTWQPRSVPARELAGSIGFGLLGRIPDNLLDEFSPEIRQAGKKLRRKVSRR